MGIISLRKGVRQINTNEACTANKDYPSGHRYLPCAVRTTPTVWTISLKSAHMPHWRM